MPYTNLLLSLNLFGLSFLLMDKNAVLFEEFFLALTFCIFFLAVISSFYTYALSYYVERINAIRSNYKKIFLRRKESLNLLIENYKSYKNFPDQVLEHATVVYLKTYRAAALELSKEKQVIEEAYRKILQGYYRE